MVRRMRSGAFLALVALLLGANAALAQVIELTDGMVDPVFGVRNAVYTYTVRYASPDAGLPPLSVQVVIDGTAYTMQRAPGQPDYAAGVIYSYQRRLSTGGMHTYHFEARNSGGYAVYDHLILTVGEIEIEKETDPDTGEVTGTTVITVAEDNPWPAGYSVPSIKWVSGARTDVEDTPDNTGANTLTFGIPLDEPPETAPAPGDRFELPPSRSAGSPFIRTGDFRNPRINDAPVLSNPKVSPRWDAMGLEAHWMFGVTYSDVDGNRPDFVQLILGKAKLSTRKMVLAADTGSVSITPVNPSNRLLNVLGVWDNSVGTGTNYYTGGYFNADTGVITLGTPLPAAGPVYVTYHSTPITWLSATPHDLVKVDPGANSYTQGVEYITSSAIRMDAFDGSDLYYYAFEAGDEDYFDRRDQYPASVVPVPPNSPFAAVSEEVGTGGPVTTYQLTFNGAELTSGDRTGPVAPVVYGPDAFPFGVEVRRVPVGGAVARLDPAQYTTDYALGTVELKTPAATTDKITASYWFAMPLQYVSPPALSDGKVTPEIGSRSEAFTYSVVYRDASGKAPDSVSVVIDGASFDMTPVGSGTPDYRAGVEYSYSTMLAPEVPHGYRFEATNAGGYAVYDALPLEIVALYYHYTDNQTDIVTSVAQNWWSGEFAGSELTWISGLRADSVDPVEGVTVLTNEPADNTIRTDDPTIITVTGVLNSEPEREPFPGDKFTLVRSRSSLWPITETGDIEGPAVNDSPTLSNSQASPSTSISMPDTNWTFQTTYSDIDNDAPGFVYVILGQAANHALEVFNSTGTSSVTVTPVDPGTPGEAPPKLLNVVGVWDNAAGTGTNYFTGGTFDPSSGVVTLGTPLAAAGPVYVTYHSTPIKWAPEGARTGRISLVKLDPSDTNFTDGVIYTTSSAIQFEGPTTANIAADPPRLNYYAFEASDGFTRARYTPTGARPSPGAYGVEADEVVTGDRQNYQMTFGGFPLSAPPNPVSPVVVGPLASVTMPDLVPGAPVVTLAAPGADPAVLTQGDFAAKTEYEVDYALGRIRLGATADVDDAVRASYWFARALPVVQYNNPPVLTSGRVNPETGSQFTTYTYSVVYTDTDGLNGTAPSYVRVVIDGVPYTMQRVSSGQPIYRNGVEYRYQTTLVANAAHRYHFETSDGYGYAVFHAPSVPVSAIQFNADTTVVSAANPGWKPSEHKNATIAWVTGKRAGLYDMVLDSTASTLTVSGALNADPATQPAVGDQFKVTRSQSSLTAFNAPGAIDGPFINDAPYLTTSGSYDTGISPTTGRRDTQFTYSTWYHDSDNDAPADGYPIVWIGGSVWEFNGGIISRLHESVTLITDSSQSWTPSQFKGQPLTWITGKRVGITDTILDNTSRMLIVSGRLDSSIVTRPEVSDQFGILQSTGTASAIDYRAAAFEDDSKQFIADSLAGKRVQMVVGNAMGAVFAVTANTAQFLAISDRLLPTSSADPEVVATGVSSGDSYSIQDMLVGAITLNLNDNGYVSMRFGNAPGWLADQFAGLVIQMMTGDAAWKKYTIISNTEDTLYFAQQASVFVNDGVKTGDEARVAGLKMEKVTAGANDYTVPPGVQFAVTVPGLGIGDHTARWMVSNSPTVRGVRTTYQNKYPSSSSQSGPLVTDTAPPGNAPPKLDLALATPSIGKTTDNYRFSVRYLDADGDPPGPHDGVSGFVQLVVDAEINGQIVRRTYRSSVDPVTGGSWPANVYRTIDSTVFSGFLIDASLAPLPPGSHRFHFEASDGWTLVRFPTNAANDPSVVVNSRPRLTLPDGGGVTPSQGNSGTTFRFRVIYSDGDNQAPAVVSLVLTRNGIVQAPLVMTKEVSADENYADGATYYVDTTLSPATYAYQFTASDPVEGADPTQAQAGPVVRSENNAPELLQGAVTPPVAAFAGNAFNYSVRYRDADNDPPNSVSVTVYAADGTMVLDSLQMDKANPADNAYSSEQGVLYEYAAYHFGASGTFFYQFSASDGNPATGDVDRKTGPIVNTPPALSAPGVDMLSGLSDQLFTFSVTYADPDDAGPTVDGFVRLVLTQGSTVTRVDMTPQAGTGWAGGVLYQVQTQLAPGTHMFSFEASDGYDAAVSTLPMGPVTVTATAELRSASVAPAVGKSSDTYSYTVILANPGGTGPDEILVFIDGTDDASSHVMTKVNPADQNYAAGVQYRYQTTLAPSATVPGGKHNWFVRARVGGQTIYAPGQSPDTPSIGPKVNSAPVLSAATINPTFGRPSDTPFTFQITYTDADKVAPAAGGYVRVIVSGVTYAMSPPAVPDWTKPVVYSVTTTMPGGQHTFFFEASDGIEATRLPSGTGQFDGPRVSTRPSLTNGSVSPETGSTATVFTYNVTYSDPEGDAPSGTGVQVLIDGQPYAMTRVSGVPNYVTGAVYTYSTSLSAGTHNFMFQASDGIDLVASELQTGKPLVDVVGLTVNATPNPAALGAVITVTGEVLPRRAATLNVVLDRPTGANINRTVASDSSGAYSFTFVTDEVGVWDVRVTDPSTSAMAALSPKLTVNKATLRVQGGVADMISTPVMSSTGDPSAIFGSAAALALNIVRWVPTSAAYKRYGTDLDFPVLTASSGFWIKPAATTTLELTGTLQDQTQPITARVNAGWNQIGSGFVRPVNWADILVKFGSQNPVSIATAEANGWVRSYAWGYEPLQRRYFLVMASGGESSTLDPFRGYWVRAFVTCDLIIQPPAE